MRRGILIAFLLILVLAEAAAVAVLSDQPENMYPDGSLLLNLLLKTLKASKEGNLTRVHELVNDLSNTTLPSDIINIHKKTYGAVLRLAEETTALRYEAGLLLNKTAGNEDKVRSLIIRVYADRLEIEDYLKQYTSVLVRYVPKEIRTMTSLRARREIDSYLSYLDSLITQSAKALELCLTNITGRGYIIPFKEPDKIVGGSAIHIPVKIGWGNNSPEKASISVTLNIENRYFKEVRYVIPTGIDSYNVSIRIPGAKELSEYGISGDASVFIGLYLYGKFNTSKILLGRTLIRTSLILLKPRIEFHVPSLVLYGSDVQIPVSSTANTTLNVSIFLDESLFMNTSLPPGQSIIFIPRTNITKGYHTIRFVVNPYGPYLSNYYSASLAVAGKPINASVRYTTQCLIPITTCRIYGEVGNYNNSAPLYLLLQVNGRNVSEEEIGENFVADIPLPLTMFASSFKVVVMIYSESEQYDPYLMEVEVFGVSIVSIIGIVALGIATVFLGYSIRIFESEKRWYPHIRILSPRKILGGESLSRKYLAVKISPSVLAQTYWKTVYELKKIFRIPYPYETLREYVNGVTKGLREDISRVLWEATNLVEKDLYSLEKPSKNRLLQLLGWLKDALK